MSSFRKLINLTNGRLAGLACLLGSLVACQEAQEKPVLKEQNLLNLQEIRPGARWIYEVKHTFHLSAQLPDQDITLKELGAEVHYELTRSYVGKKSPTKAHDLYHCFQEERENKLTDTEYLALSSDTLRLVAWRGQDMPAPLIFDPPITLFAPEFQEGSEWGGEVKDPQGHVIIKRTFRHHGKERVRVPAGKFEAVKMEERGDNLGLEIRRFYWFVNGLGVVKEKVSHYSKHRLLFHQVKELKAFQRLSKK